MQKRAGAAVILGKKRKSQPPQRSFPSGYRDSSPGVVLSMDFGDDFAYVKRALSSSASSVTSNSSSYSSLDANSAPSSPSISISSAKTEAGVGEEAAFSSTAPRHSGSRKGRSGHQTTAASTASSSRVTRNSVRR